MHLSKIIACIAIVGCGFFLGGCEKYFEGVNDNPNQPEAVSLDMLLPTTQLQLAYGNGGDISRHVCTFIQHIKSIDRCISVNIYRVNETDFDNYWRFNMYGGALMDLYKMGELAEAADNRHYAGISKILLAYGMLSLTDLFGDVPYSEAFQEADNLTPKWDSQESIYTAMLALLEEGKADLRAELVGYAPGADDLVHGGDMAAWIKTANVMQARAYLHLGKVSAANYQNALDALGTEGVDSYGSEAENASVQFGTSPTEAAPYNQWIEQRNDIDYNNSFINQLMSGLGDPRYAIYFDSTNNTLGQFFARPDAFYHFATYAEQKFIEAEAAFQTGDLVRAASAHNAAVLASLGRYGVSDATFEANHAQETAATISLQKIMEQKYIALYLEPESFTDWRRTGFPALVAVPNNVTGDIIPRRLPYPQSERLYNSGNFQFAPITNRLWWDRP